MSTVDFSEFDPKTVRKFMFHVINAYRKDPPLSAPLRQTRAIPEIFHESFKHIHHTPAADLRMRLDAMEQRLEALHGHVHGHHVVHHHVVKHATTGAAKKTPVKKKTATPVTKKSAASDLKATLRKLETIHRMLEKSGEHAEEDLMRVKKKILSLKKQLEK